jgi:hypothetical protein
LPVRAGTAEHRSANFNGVGVYETIANRRIEQAQKEGLFDNLPGKGKPIADLHYERPPGWWAMRMVRAERNRSTLEQLEGQIGTTRASFWRAGSETEVRQRVAEANRQISAYNTAAAVRNRKGRIDPSQIVARWRYYQAVDNRP